MVARTSLIPNPCGAIAQLGERIVRNDEVVGSIPTSSTKITSFRAIPELVYPPARVVRRFSAACAVRKRLA